MRRFHAFLLGAAISVVLLTATPRALAQGFATEPGYSFENPLGSPPGTRWRNGRDRWFVSGRVDVGFLFLRPRASFGYGRPHYAWAGLDVVPTVSLSAAGGYTGLRWDRKFFSIRSGMLYQYSFSRSFLPIQQSYDKRDIDVVSGPHASYWLWDSELEVYFPLGDLRVRSQTQPFYAGDVPEGYNVYLDNIRVVAGPGLTLRQRGGVEFFWPRTTIGITPQAEMVWLDARNEVVIRVGVQLRWLLSDEFEVRTDFLPVIWSPDRLGRAGSDVLEFALRWRFATN